MPKSLRRSTRTLFKATRRNQPLLLALLLLLISGSCQKVNVQKDQAPDFENSGNNIANAEVTREYSISPATTDPNINTFLGAHFISVKEGATLKNTLFLFIPGTYRVPSECK